MSPQEALFSIFEPALVQEIEASGRWMTFADGEVIIEYGRYIQFMPIVVQGNIKVYRMDESGSELLLYYLSSQESCSMAYNCCLEEKQSEVRAVAEDAVELIGIPHQKLDEWLCKYPSWRRYVLRSFNDRLQELLQSIERIAFHKLDRRLISYLKQKQHMSGSSVLRISHAQIAEELATSRVVVSRLLKQLEREGLIMLYRNEIKLMKRL